jgi:2'-5' RNA ligase
MNSPDDTLPNRYLRLWHDALPVIRGNEIQKDSVLASGIPDARRGLTLIARPSVEVQNRILEMLATLRADEPEQYYYVPESLHVTILSLLTSTTEHEGFSADVPGYAAAIERVLREARPFQIAFRGITASPAAIMLQGFPQDPILEEIRTRLRQELKERGLATGVDVRYRIITAHMTVMRFQKPLRDAWRFANALEQYRMESFGDLVVKELSFIKNDWFASPEQTTTLARFPLPAARGKQSFG